MKILLIDVNCKSGSTGKLVFDLYTELEKSGHIPAIAYGRGKKVIGKNIIKFGYDVETYFHVFMNRITGVHGSFSFFSTLRLIRFIKEFNPDVIHIHELHGYFVNIVSIINFLKKLNKKVIWTFHSEYMYEGKGFIINKNLYPKWKRISEYPKSWFFDFSKWSVNRYKKAISSMSQLKIVTPSVWLKKRTLKTFFKRFPIIVINNGVDQDIFKNYDYDYCYFR
jgi:glycosyltransferase involved in cell wall biosynthesis